MIKKILTSLIATIFIATIPVSTYATESNTNSTSEDTIKNTIINYFTSNLEAEKQQKAINNEYIDENSLLKECNALTYELKGKVNKAHDLQLESYSCDININSTTFENNLIKINVDNNVTCKYNSSDDISKYSESHILYLKNVNDKLLVEQDIESLEGKSNEIESFLNKENSISNNSLTYSTSDTYSPYESYTQKQIDLLKSDLNNISRYLPNTNLNSYSIYKKASSFRDYNVIFNRQGAVNYALQHVSDPPRYSSDCTNFVSKALHYGGGIPKDYSSSRTGWYELEEGTPAWVSVEPFWEWIVCRKGYAADYYSEDFANPGDVIQLQRTGYSMFTHTVIVTGRRGNMLYVSAHTNPSYNVPITNYYPTGTYENIRYLTFG